MPCLVSPTWLAGGGVEWAQAVPTRGHRHPGWGPPIKKTALSCPSLRRGLPPWYLLPEPLLPGSTISCSRSRWRDPPNQASQPRRHRPPRDTTYLGTAAWPPWTGASSLPGSCLCPARAGWEAPSPQSAGGALGRGHLVTGATRPDSTESWPTDTHHLRGERHRPCLCLLAPHGSPDHSRHIWAGPNLLQPATFKTKLVIFPVRPHQGKEHRPPGYSSRK